MNQIFITATDTDAGKTFVSCAIISALKQHKTNSTNETLTVAAFKPVAAGCELVDGELINEDAKLLCEFSNAKQSIQQINPIAFEAPIAPHIAAKKQNRTITIAELRMYFQQVKLLNADFTLVEGAGGWRLPLGEVQNIDSIDTKKFTYQFLSDFVKAEQIKVVLIVNMKLGCLNHALLTYEAIKADGLECVAWIANCADSNLMNNLAENINELEHLLPIPKIAQLDFIESVDEQGNELSFENKVNLAASKINLAPLL
jgi:dethiobiotin synthetase